MKFRITFFIFTVTGVLAHAQTKVSGKITDPKGNPLSMVNVSVTGTYDGGSSDPNGVFEFTTSGSGTKELVASFIGFKDFRKNIDLNGSTLFFVIQLHEVVRTLDAVTITAGSFTAGDQSRRTIFRAVDIATTAGATADIAGALNTLPGTQKVGESGRLFVRGGDAIETRTFIDGQIVFEPYSSAAPNTPSRGRFLPFMFKGTSFSTGGYSAEYGQALSSALVLDSKDKAEMTRTDIGILSVGADVGHTQAWDRSSVSAKIQYTNIRPYFGLIDQNIEWLKPPASIEGNAAFRRQSGQHGLLKIYGNFNQSDFSLYKNDIDIATQKERYDLSNQYRYLNGSYKNILNGNWVIKGGFSWTGIHQKIFAATREISEVANGFHGKTVFEGSLSERVEIKAGAEAINRAYSEETNGVQRNFDELITAAFVEADVYANSRFVSRGGARLEYNALTRQLSLDPRLSMAWKTGSSGQVSVAYGRFRQSPKNELLRINAALQSEKADHYILNYQHIEDNRIFRIEGYYKRYRNLVKYLNGDEQELNNAGYGFANGIELFWRDHRSLKNVDYWVAYSLLNTRRNYLDFPVEAKPAFASRHNVSIVYKHFITPLKSQLGFTWSYTSGRPYHDPNEGTFNGSMTPPYIDLSFNWSYLPTPSLILYFSCTNLTGRDHVYGYEFSREQNEQGIYNGRAIGPPAKRFLFAGVFITLSKEKSVNQLPNL